MKSKKINPVFTILGGFIILSLVFVAIAGNQATEGETAMDELQRDSVGLILAVSNNSEDKLQDYQKSYQERKNPVVKEKLVTPEFKIEESNLSEKKKKNQREREQDEDSDDLEKDKERTEKQYQVVGTYESPYKKEGSSSSGSGSNIAREKDTKPSKRTSDVEDLFNTSTGGSGGSVSSSKGKYKAVIHGDQKVRDGGSVKLRLQEDAIIAGQKVPRNTIFFGTLMGSEGGRLQIVITQFGNVSGNGIVLDNDQQVGIRYDQAVDNPTAETGKSIGRQITSDLLQKLPGGRYADQLVRSAKSSDGSIYLIDQYKIFIQID